MRLSTWAGKCGVTLTATFIVFIATAAVAQMPVVAQVPLKATSIPQFTQELPRLTLLDAAGKPLDPKGIPVTGGLKVDISMCEFQREILPPNTPVVGAVPGVAPKTWIWGYQASPDCTNPGGSYIGPVVVAVRGTPTEMTYINLLGDASASNVLAYKQSTDQTLQWADPFSLLTTPYPPPMFGNPFPGIPYVNGFPEKNYCNEAVKTKLVGAPLPPPCADNFGAWMNNTVPPTRMGYTAPVAAAPHLHGGEIPAMLDGGPDAWWTSNGIYGHGYYSKNGTGDAAAGKAVYTYPNKQDPAPTWFHDHVLGATRLNVYAGIAGAYYQVDPNFTLPTGMDPLGLRNGAPAAPGGPATTELLIPLVIQDRMFDTNGQLYFPNLGINLTEHPYWVPEFVGDVIVVNGKSWPKVTVEPKRYRFLVLNGSNARTYELFLINPLTGIKGPSIWVIGNDQGYLDKTVLVNPNAKKPNNKLIVMPGERYEIIIDFAGIAPGTILELRNTAQTPYPGGIPTQGQTTAKIVQFVINPQGCTSGFCGVTDASYNPAPAGTAIRPAGKTIVRLANANGTPAVAVQKTRRLTLNEFVGAGGPLEILVNNTTYVGAEPGVAARVDFTGITTKWNTTYYSELPHEGETELWEIVNLTADAHPIHPHLVAFQILNREAFNFKGYNAVYNQAFGGIYLPGIGPPLDYNCGAGAPGRGPALDPAGNPCILGGNPDITPFLSGIVNPPLLAERGWKDTAISYPGEVLRLMVRFAPTGLANSTAPDNAWYEFDPNHGHGFVWHCHIIDHEDNEMMRPFTVWPNPNPAVVRTFNIGVDY